MTIQRNKIRKYTNGEIFTPIELVNEILDKLPKEYFTDSSKTICEPSVGEGIFLVEILRRRLENGLSSTESLKTLYGLDIMEDNISVCKLRLSGDEASAGKIGLPDFTQSSTTSIEPEMGLDWMESSIICCV